MRQLTAFQEDLLYAISGLDDPSGQNLIEYLSGSKMYEYVNHGRLYPNLDQLVDRGYVQKGSVNDRTNYYALLPDGKEWLRQRRKYRDEISGNFLTAD